MFDTIKLNTQAEEQYDGLPIGNGRLEAIISGNNSSDIISLNHEWLWTGLYRNFNDGFKEKLSEIRGWLSKGDYMKAATYSNAYFGENEINNEKKIQDYYYIPAGALKVEILNSKFINRELSFNDAVVSILRKARKTKVKSEIFAHSQNGLIIGKWFANRVFSCGISFSSLIPDSTFEYSDHITVLGNTIVYNASIKDGIEYRVIITIQTDGEIVAHKNTLRILNAFEVEAYINIVTSENGIDKEASQYPLPQKNWNEMLDEHKKGFSRLYNKVNLSLSLPDNNKNTDKLYPKKRVKEAVFPLLFNLSRYLLISSTINCKLPPNSQGKWCSTLSLENKCDYHFNQSIHMFYQIAERVNLFESVDLLTEFIQTHKKLWREEAQELFDNSGIFVPDHTDSHGRAISRNIQIGAAAWLSRIIMNHYEHTGDIEFLSNTGYPFLKETALFYEDYLYEDKNNKLHVIPSQYPETHNLLSNRIGRSSALDASLAYDALGAGIKASETLGIDEAQRKKWLKMREKLKPVAIDSNGLLSEWLGENQASDPRCFHYSSLYGLFPSEILNEPQRKNELEAAFRTLDYYISHDTQKLAENIVWAALMYAKGGRGVNAKKLLDEIINKDNLSKSLLFTYNDRLGINVNLTLGAAIIECIVSFYNGKVYLLESLPIKWAKKGSLNGIRVPGGHILNIAWENGRIKKLEITMGYLGKIVFAELKTKLKLSNLMESSDNDIVIEKKPGEKIILP